MSEFLILVRRYVHDDASDGAVQDTAQIIESGRRHGFIFAQLVNCCTGYMMLVD